LFQGVDAKGAARILRRWKSSLFQRSILHIHSALLCRYLKIAIDGPTLELMEKFSAQGPRA